jgi:hypothetical protein
MGSNRIILCILLVIMTAGNCIKGMDKTKENRNSHLPWIGMIETLDEIKVDDKKLILILLGEGFHDKAFFICLFSGDIPKTENGGPDTDKALVYEYIDLKEAEVEEFVYKATRSVKKGKIDWENKKVIISFTNGDSEDFGFEVE